MPTYTILYAEDVPHYGTCEIEAADDSAALAKATAIDDRSLQNLTQDADHENSVTKRIVHIERSDGLIVAHDVPLDDCHLRSGGEQDRKLCDAAPHFLKALKTIAATPLWGEPVGDPGLRADYIECGEYDAGDNSFEPSCDTESTLLRDAVEEAREALNAYAGKP